MRSTPENADPLHSDYSVLDQYGIDWAPIPYTVPGQAVTEIHIRAQDGRFLPEIRVGKVSDRVKSIALPQRWHQDPIINYLCIQWFLGRVSEHSPSIVQQTAIGLLDCLDKLIIPVSHSHESFGLVVQQWAVSSCLASTNDDFGHKRNGALRSFLEFSAQEIGYGIDDRIASCLIGLSSEHSRKTRGIYVLTLDDEYGPFTASQRVSIDRLIQSGKLSVKEEALIRLHRFVGLRPSQTSLLRESDLVEEDEQWYLDVPMVKLKGSAHRRRKDQFRRYKIPFEVANALQKLIESEANNFLICPVRKTETKQRSSRPIFKSANRKYECLDERDAEYFWHMGSHELSSLFNNISNKYALTAVSSDPTKNVSQPIRISAYRFRYTVGTMLAQKGASLRQIALWLGHRGEESVRFYLHMAQEWWDHDFTLSTSEQQQKAIANLHGALVDRLPRKSNGEMSNCIAATGYCVLPPGVIECPYDPMRSCSSCPNRRDTTVMAVPELLEAAIKSNEEEIMYWQANSTASTPLGLLTEREKHADAYSILKALGENR